MTQEKTCRGTEPYTFFHREIRVQRKVLYIGKKDWPRKRGGSFTAGLKKGEVEKESMPGFIVNREKKGVKSNTASTIRQRKKEP